MTSRIHWHPCIAAPQLESGALHLWRIRTDDRGANQNRCLALLEARQRRRAEGMRHGAYRERYVRAQAGLRRILAFYLACEPKDIRFQHGEAGKPQLPADRAPIGFNLTTTGDLALVGVALGAAIGIDCERIRPGRDIEAIAGRMFEPEQRRALAAASEPDRLEQFYRAWTALEADAKADGRGLFRPRSPDSTRPEVRHFIPEDGYIAAVAGERLPPAAGWQTFGLDE